MISSYQAAQKYMSKARDPEKGRPMQSAGWRLHQYGNEYVVNVQNKKLGRFLPNNSFVFSLTSETAAHISPTLCITMNRNLPFEWKRCGKGMYRVDHRQNIELSVQDHFLTPTNAPQVYDGLWFDLFTGRCFNYRPDRATRIIPERRKEWLAALKAWKNRMKVAARVGAFDALIASELADRTPWTERVQWGSRRGLDTLYKVIKDNDCSVETMRKFVASANGHVVQLTSQQVYVYIEKVLNAQSVELRKRFGVFEGE